MTISREELQEKVNKIIFNFGQEYLSELEEYEKIKSNEDYSEKYKESKRAEILKRIRADREKDYKSALELVQEERNKVESEKSAYEKLSIEEKTLKALEKNNLIQITIQRVKGAPVEILREILEGSNFDNDVKTIVQTELSDRSRGENGLSDSEVILDRELRHIQDMFSVVENNLRVKLLEENNVYISLGTIRSIEKDFDIILNHNYFSVNTDKEHYFSK